MKNFFIPNKNNNHTPHLLGKKAILVYVLGVFLFNFLAIQFNLNVVSADVAPQELLEAHNRERVSAGLQPLSLNNKLSSAANSKASVMLETNCWSHYCPAGTSPWEFFVSAGYNYQFAGENLAEGFNDTSAVMVAWLNSPTHRENILNANYREVGFGFASGNYQGKGNNLLIVVHFGTEFTGTVGTSPDLSATEVSPLENNSITIDNLTDDRLNKSRIDVIGRVNPPNSQVGILFNGEEKSRINATGVNYTYRSTEDLADGKLSVQSILYDSLGTEINKSNTIELFLDGAKPFVVSTSVIVTKSGENFLVRFKTSADTTNVLIDVEEISIDKDINGYWTITLDDTVVNANNRITFTLSDQFSNASQFYIDSKDILSVELDEDFVDLQGFNIQTNIPINFLNQSEGNQIGQIVPIGFIIYLLILFGLDFTILAKTDMLGKVKRKPHLYFSIFAILFVSISMGNLSGSILSGLNT